MAINVRTDGQNDAALRTPTEERERNNNVVRTSNTFGGNVVIAIDFHHGASFIPDVGETMTARGMCASCWLEARPACVCQPRKATVGSVAGTCWAQVVLFVPGGRGRSFDCVMGHVQYDTAWGTHERHLRMFVASRDLEDALRWAFARHQAARGQAQPGPRQRNDNRTAKRKQRVADLKKRNRQTKPAATSPAAGPSSSLVAATSSSSSTPSPGSGPASSQSSSAPAASSSSSASGQALLLLLRHGPNSAALLLRQICYP